MNKELFLDHSIAEQLAAANIATTTATNEWDEPTAEATKEEPAKEEPAKEECKINTRSMIIAKGKVKQLRKSGNTHTQSLYFKPLRVAFNNFRVFNSKDCIDNIPKTFSITRTSERSYSYYNAWAEVLSDKIRIATFITNSEGGVKCVEKYNHSHTVSENRILQEITAGDYMCVAIGNSDNLGALAVYLMTEVGAELRGVLQNISTIEVVNGEVNIEHNSEIIPHSVIEEYLSFTVKKIATPNKYAQYWRSENKKDIAQTVTDRMVASNPSAVFKADEVSEILKVLDENVITIFDTIESPRVNVTTVMCQFYENNINKVCVNIMITNTDNTGVVNTTLGYISIILSNESDTFTYYEDLHDDVKHNFSELLEATANGNIVTDISKIMLPYKLF